ncbi:MAG: NADH-FMN oxidoreductase [uncultured Paraburkholderia sp.]|nr:MAG: NADH-FMN oxidoreductase [uncultured Paraburkholderia sp.]CAH2803881.1 MAG: NADH-FMN oxidoreductase [uncultured Paraburkholderia sp.]CAH2938918.1 MAG: NADH-FMN oxidoreductase [uncultured Paraburkholderia sp.]CAH2940653.1 MAG: NADH-FMN oxidoreductase [uncultured Paraburkholderia sp.]
MHAQALRIDEPHPAGFDERRFRRALGRFATGVVLISTGSGERLHAMTANAFMSCSLKPPLIVVSVGQRARMHERLMASAFFGVSVLSDAQEAYSRHFAPVEGLADVVLLEHAAARFAARVVDRHPCGDHTLFVGEVLVFSLDEHAPLIFFAGVMGRSPPVRPRVRLLRRAMIDGGPFRSDNLPCNVRLRTMQSRCRRHA